MNEIVIIILAIIGYLIIGCIVQFVHSYNDVDWGQDMIAYTLFFWPLFLALYVVAGSFMLIGKVVQWVAKKFYKVVVFLPVLIMGLIGASKHEDTKDK